MLNDRSEELKSKGKQKLCNTSLFAFILLFFCQLPLHAQESSITLSVQNITLTQFFNAIEKQSNYKFMYRDIGIPTDSDVTIAVTRKPIDEVLHQILSPRSLSYSIDGIKISVTKASVKSGQKTPRQITGNVVDEKGEPIIGANISVKGTTNGTISNLDGNFNLNASEGQTLLITYLGYFAKEQTISSGSTYKIIMIENMHDLDEVVVIGYGSMKKSDLTGSVATVNNASIVQRPVASAVQGMQGRVAGVQVVQPSGAPGVEPYVRIRGSNSIQYGNDPLYVVDGFPVAAGTGLTFLNPNDIETMTILKDASATAIYGSRGANGVVVVTTKKGTSGRTHVNYEYYYGAQSVIKKLDLLNAKEFATLSRLFWSRFRKGSLISRAYKPEEIDKMGEGTDWQDAIFRSSAPVQSHNISISGGSEKTRFTMSGNYFDQDGVVINSKYQKGTVGMTVDHTANSRFKMGASIFTSYQYNQSIPYNTGGTNSCGVIDGALFAAPTLPVKYEDGTYSNQEDVWNKQGIFLSPMLQNPVQMAYERQSNSNSTRVLGNGFASYEIINGLTLKVSIGADINNRRENYYVPSYFINQKTSKGTASISQAQRINWVNENTLTYIKTIHKKHHLNALIGFTSQQERTDGLSAGSTQFVSDNTGYYNLGLGADAFFPGSSFSRWSMASFLGRINYDYDNRYLLTISARYDGSSRFGSNNKFGFFPSAAIAWRASQEAFLKEVEWLSDLKIRGSYGRTGNQEIPLYQNVQVYSQGGIAVIGNSIVPGIIPGSMVNPNLKWETTDQYDAGFDISFFNSRLTFAADYYYKKTTDLLYPVSVPRQSGYTTILKNVGSVQNQGVELSLNANLGNKDFQWNGSMNFSLNRNRVLKLGGGDRFFAPGIGGVLQPNGSAANIIMEGQPLGMFWGNIFDGLWQTEEEYEAGHMKNNTNSGPGFENYRDIDGNGVFEEGVDETIVGNPHPDFEFGFNNTFKYRHFDLSFFLNGVVGNDILNVNKIELTTQINGMNGLKIYKEAWDGPGTSNTIAKIDRHDGRSGVFANRVSTNYLEDGSFIRLRNLTLGYTLPKKAVPFLSNLRVYLSGENLFTITGYTGYDPEVSSKGNSSISPGIDMATYPSAKTYRFGVQIGF